MTICSVIGCLRPGHAHHLCRMHYERYRKHGDPLHVDRAQRRRARPADLDIGDITWHRDALCAQTDPELFFPEAGVTSKPAKLICAHCDVRVQCLEWALEHETGQGGHGHGIYGGLGPTQRERLKRRLQEAGAA